MTKRNFVAGGLWITASVGFFVSWLLMPDPGTTDTVHILNIVKHARTNVRASVIIQISCSILYIAALFYLAKLNLKSKTAFVGIISLGVGLLGLCSDAFFHLLAYFMTDDLVKVQQDIVRVMDSMQTTGVKLLIPILLPFFIGSLVIAIGLHRQKIISNTSAIVIICAFCVGILSAIEVKTHLSAPVPVMVIIAIFSIGQAFMGFELIRPFKGLQPQIVNYKYELGRQNSQMN